MIALALMVGCAAYRSYPMLTLDLPGRHPPLEPSGLAVMPDQRLVMVTEGDATHLYTPTPDTPLGDGGVLEIFPLQDGRKDCRRPDAQVRCVDRKFRANVELHAEPIRWLPREKGVTVPYDVEDLTAFEGDSVLGVTEFSTVGRRTAFRKDYQARSRRQTERLFVLARTAAGWEEQSLPEIDRLRDALADWGRGACNEDMFVEGLAYDPTRSWVYVGLSRCKGPAAKVLRFDLGAARADLAATLDLVSDGIAGRALGPAEGLSGLSWSGGRLWALTSWDSYGYDTEPAFGGQLHVMDGGHLVPVDVPGRFVDRPSALAVLAPPTPSTPFEDLDALVLFDNDAAAGNPTRPNATVLRARTPRPAWERYAQLLALTPVPDAPRLALNGFDLRWYARDHRLGQIGFVLDQAGTNPPGAWTRAVGGLWQIQVGGSMGSWAAALGLGKRVGHNKQAAAFTDLGPNVTITGYRARVSVLPRDRERQNPSVADLLDRARDAYRVSTPLPVEAGPDAALVLQGFEIDTSSRADQGICLAALDLGVGWAGGRRDAVSIQSTIIGGICNDFDSRGPAYHHGRTTAQTGGVELIVHFAVVEGAATSPWSARVFDRSLPAPPDTDPERATDDDMSRAQLQCVRFGPDNSLNLLDRQPAAAPREWLSVAGEVHGTPAGGASALSGFTLAVDPAGFDLSEGPRALTEAEALARNNYIYRYLLRAFTDESGLFLEGGLSHGIHKTGLMRDNARASAVLVGATGTTFPGLAGTHTWDVVAPSRRADPNLLPEDGFIRWAPGLPLAETPSCSPSW